MSCKNGQTSRYGTICPPAAPPGWSDQAVIRHPASERSGQIFAWKLTETRDPFGNRIQYDYQPDIGDSDGHQWNQPLLKRIRYVDYDDPAQPTFMVTVEFQYEQRPDPFSHYRAGFEIRTTLRCNSIRVSTHTTDGAAHPVCEYLLTYQQDPNNGSSLLKEINSLGFDDAGLPSSELHPITFSYTHFEPTRRRFEPVTGRDLPSQALSDPSLELVDLHGSGLPDILELNGSVRYWRNLGNGQFDLPRFMREAPAHSLADPGVQLIDANGDGRVELMVTSTPLAGYYSLTRQPAFDRRSFRAYPHVPSFNLEDQEVKLVDLDGDGITDILRSGSRLECFFNDMDPSKAWRRTAFVPRQALEVFPNVNFSDPRVRLADMTGDGLQDIVLIHDGNIEYWPNLGHGNWGKRLHMRHSPRFPDSRDFSNGYDPRRILVGDVDGDGLADVIYIDHGRVLLWINQSGNAWSKETIVIHGTPPVNNMDAVRLVDLHGAGVSGILWSSDAGDLTRHNLMFLDFTGGSKPYLLNEMNNHMGAVTRVGYKPSTYYYLADRKNPKTRWRTPLPFPVQVVARVEVLDELSGGKLTTEYRYHHGYWDGTEREFRGFGMVEQLDTETFEAYNAKGLHGQDASFNDFEDDHRKVHFSAPLLTRTWFHQGPVGKKSGDWQEVDYTGEYWPGDPQLLGHTEQVNDFLRWYGPPYGSATPPCNRRIKRDALRALRGNILRTELYALDRFENQSNTGPADRPYTVTEQVYGLQEISSSEITGVNRQRVFFPHLTALRTTQWERGDDPMTQFSFMEYRDFAGRFDDFGRPRAETMIACPRGWRRMSDRPSEGYLATRTCTVYAQPHDSPGPYIHDRVSRVTTYELTSSANRTVIALRDLADNDASLKIINQMLHYYDRDPTAPENGAFYGLPLGQIGEFGVLVRSLSLVLTDDVLQAAYGPNLPPFLAEPSNWTVEYPQAFRDQLPDHAGYLYQPDGSATAGWFAAMERRRYDFHDTSNLRPCGLLLAQRDSIGKETHIRYDPHALLPVEVSETVDANTWLTTTALHNYRVLRPRLIIDPNNNETGFEYSPTGLLSDIRVKGKSVRQEGDRSRPSVRFTYDFRAFEQHGRPVFVRTTRHIHHDTENEVPLPKRDETITTIEYSDCFGRLLQTRAQGEDVRFGNDLFGGGALVLPDSQTAGAGYDVTGRLNTDAGNPNVVVSGVKTYDNKGRVVEQYEPYYETGWEYKPAPPQGARVTMFYDPRGQMVRTVNPDGSERRVIYGRPHQLQTPELFDPTPWEAYTYDANDNAGRTHPYESTACEHYHDTPASIIIDGLGRTVETVEHNCSSSQDPVEELRNSFCYDIRGNLLLVQDPLVRDAFTYVYDLANRPLRVVSIDAGDRRMVYDAAGNIIETRDKRGGCILQAYDSLNRPARMWARDSGGEVITLREVLSYGDDLSPDTNQRGRLIQHNDEAGTITLAYDFKGNVTEKTRLVIDPASVLAAFDPSEPGKVFCVDWDTPPEIDPTTYKTTTAYDALNRVKTLIYPQSTDGIRRVLKPTYNRAGMLERVGLDNELFVERIAYNARGQRVLIAYGNSVMTRYAYDSQTFHLRHLRTERFTHPNDNTLVFHPNGLLTQDLAYTYDLGGNILAIQDRVPGCGVPGTTAGNNALDRIFAYDAIYRLLSATGRETNESPPLSPWQDTLRSNDPTCTRSYTQNYTYDAAGNLKKLQHTASGGSFTRHLEIVHGSNRLAYLQAGNGDPVRYTYTYDNNGNITGEAASRHFAWDHSDRMKTFNVRAGNSAPSQYAHYSYDSAGMRVMKLVQTQGGSVEVTVYIDGLFESHHWVESGVAKQQNRLHVMDNQSRIALVRMGDAHTEDRGEPVQYHLGDHLGSSSVVIGGADASQNTFINREEYYPYGETSFGSFGKKRYRYSGKERDEETGLCYYGARYYAPWLCRWLNTDPAGIIDGFNIYNYVRSNPLHFLDILGEQSTSFSEKETTDDQQQGVHIIVIGTDDRKTKEEGGAGHKSPASFIRRIAFIREEPDFSQRYDQEDRVIVLVPASMDKKLLKQVHRYGKLFSSYEVHRISSNRSGDEVAEFINQQTNIESLYFIGHGTKGGPIFDYGRSCFPSPDKFNAEAFSPYAIAVFITCNSNEYAREFRDKTKVSSLGVQGTTKFKYREVEAARLHKKAKYGTSISWFYPSLKAGDFFRWHDRFIQSGSGVSSSINGKTGRPFFRP